MKLTYGSASFLFTGDINGRNKDHTDLASKDEIDSEELELWVRHQLDPKHGLGATVLQAPHHGSNGSCSSLFLKAIAPEWVVITAGHQYDHATMLALEWIGPGSLRAVRSGPRGAL